MKPHILSNPGFAISSDDTHPVLSGTARLLANLDQSLNTHLDQIGWRLLNFQSRDYLNWSPACAVSQLPGSDPMQANGLLSGQELSLPIPYQGRPWRLAWPPCCQAKALEHAQVVTTHTGVALRLHLKSLTASPTGGRLHMAVVGGGTAAWQLWESLLRSMLQTSSVSVPVLASDSRPRCAGLGSAPHHLLWSRLPSTRWSWAFWQDAFAQPETLRQLSFHLPDHASPDTQTVDLPLQQSVSEFCTSWIVINPVTASQISEHALHPIRLQPGQQVYPLEWASPRLRTLRLLRAWETHTDPHCAPRQNGLAWHIESLPDRGPLEKAIDWLIVDTPVTNTRLLSLQGLGVEAAHNPMSFATPSPPQPHDASLANCAMARFVSLRYTQQDLARLDAESLRQVLMAWQPRGSHILHPMVDAIRSVDVQRAELLTLQNGLLRRWPALVWSLHMQDTRDLPMGLATWAHLLVTFLAGLGDGQTAVRVSVFHHRTSTQPAFQTPWQLHPWQTLHPFSVVSPTTIG